LGDPVSIGVVVEKRYLSQSQPSGMTRALRERCPDVHLIDPQDTFFLMGDSQWLDSLDIIVARGRSNALLCLLRWAESCGLGTINREAAISSVYNKAHMSVLLTTAGVPTPRTFFAPVEQLAAHAPVETYPIILKPIFGDNSQGLLVVNSPEEMSAVKWGDPVALAQQYLPPDDGYDLKLYAIGEEIWAVRKPSPFNKPRAATGSEPKAEILPLTPGLEELGRRCGKLFGLELFGVDCVETPSGPLVIEINDFPNYTGVPEADQRLADYIIRRAREVKR
jgi:ribosomal protein S6--L-glutamate ligase